MEDETPNPEILLRSAHRSALRCHAIELLKLGHAKLDKSTFTSAQEEDITGKLKEAIESVIETDYSAPVWVERYTVYDEEKPSGTVKLGKQRPRIDITIKRRWKIREPHPRFRFEAKRLKADKRISAYFGKEGIGCFLRGTYPMTHPEAAMIGYVQAGALKDWELHLAAYAKKNSRRLRTASGGSWKEYPCSLSNSGITEHKHPKFERIAIIHLLLDFS